MRYLTIMAIAVASIAMPMHVYSFDKNPQKLAHISDNLNKDMWVSTGNLQTTKHVMQSFDIDFDEELIYYSQIDNHYIVYVSWGKENSPKPNGVMEVHYSGHGSNFTLESQGNDRYIWMDNYASKNANGAYWDSQIISRIPVKDGAVIKPWDCTDNYYFGEKNISVAVDIEGDRLTTLGITTGNIRTYRLSELQALPKEIITLEPIVYGGDLAPENETTKTFEVLARDCTKVKPIGDFKIKREPGISWQGFDVKGDYVYQARGNGNKNDGARPSTGWLYIFKIDGTPVLPATPIQALNNMDLLNEWGITNTGYMEPEGVKIREGALYCGFASKDSNNVRKGTIFIYSPDQVKK